MNRDVDIAIDSLTNGLTTYVDSKIDSAPFVKTDIGVIKSVTLSNNKYLHTVTVRNCDYSGIKSLGNNKFSANSIVYILIPNGQYNNMFILGHLDDTNANIKGGTINIGDGNFVVDESGKVTIKDGVIEGDIDLTDYYTKTETYNKTEVDNLISGVTGVSFEVVQVLPATGESNIIYLVPKTTAQTSNVYDEYIYVNNSWELIGDTEIDLSNYYTKTETDNKISTEIGTLDVTGDSNISASKTISSWSETDGKVSITTQDISITKSQISDFPTIPTVNDNTITIKENGNTVDTFTLNQSSDKDIDIQINQSYYGTCTDNGDVVAKSVTVSNQNFKLLTGAMISVKFTNANTASGVTLNVNGTGAKHIWYNNSDYTNTTNTSVNVYGNANQISTYIYDGTYWVWQSHGVDNNTWTAMTGATSSANGTKGYINATPPSDGYNTKYWRADGTWSVPAYPTVNNNTITIQKNGTNVDTFTLNQNSDKTINITMSKTDVDLGNVPNVTTDNQTPTFSQASTRTNIASGEKLSVIFGKIMKWFADLKSVAFSGSFNDLTNQPTTISGYGITDAKIDNGTITLGSDTITPLTSHQTIKQDGVTGATVNRFGTCSTGATTATKSVSITTGTFSLEAGATVAVNFSNTNTADNPKLKVGSTTAKNIFVNGSQITTGDNKGLLTGTVVFVYDGTQYNLIGNYLNTDSGGTVTSVKVGTTEYTPTSGVVSLPAYPTVNNATLTIQKNGSNVKTFTANASSDVTCNITVPTKTSDLTNDSSFVTTDENVKQSPITTNSDFEVIFSHSANNDEETSTVGKDTGLLYNPNKQELSVVNKTASTYPIKTDVTGRGALNGGTITHIMQTKTNCHYSYTSSGSLVEGDVVNTCYPISTISNGFLSSSNNTGIRLGSHNGLTMITAGENPLKTPSYMATLDTSMQNSEKVILASDNDIVMLPRIDSNGGVTSTITANANNLIIESNNPIQASTSLSNAYFVAGNNISSGTIGNSRGIIQCYGSNNKFWRIYDKNTTLTDDRAYNVPDKNGTIALTSDITDAINALDGGTITGTPSASKTVTALSESDGNISATFDDISIIKSQVSDLAVVDATNDGLCPHFDDTSTDKYLRQNGTWYTPLKHRQTLNSDNVYRPLLMSYADNASSSNNVYNVSYRNNKLYFNPSEGYLYVGLDANRIILGNGLIRIGESLLNAGTQDLQIKSSVSDTDYGVKIGVYETGSSAGWAFAPLVNNNMRLGSPSLKWTTIYATNSTINTSDKNEKEDIIDLDSDFSKDFIMDLKPVSFKRIEGDRTHYGLIAQDVEETLDKFDLTSMDFGGLCKDIVEKDNEQNTLYGLRYEEFIAPMIKTIQLQQQEIEELKQRVEKLENSK